MIDKISGVQFKIYIYKVYNHNNTLLGEFKTEKEAIDEMEEYTYQTENYSYIRKVRKLIK